MGDVPTEPFWALKNLHTRSFDLRQLCFAVALISVVDSHAKFSFFGADTGINFIDIDIACFFVPRHWSLVDVYVCPS